MGICPTPTPKTTSNSTHTPTPFTEGPQCCSPEGRLSFRLLPPGVGGTEWIRGRDRWAQGGGAAAGLQGLTGRHAGTALQGLTGRHGRQPLSRLCMAPWVGWRFHLYVFWSDRVSILLPPSQSTCRPSTSFPQAGTTHCIELDPVAVQKEANTDSPVCSVYP